MAQKTGYTPARRAEVTADTAGSILSVRVRGEIDHHTAADIRREIDGLLFERRPRKLILDLSAVSFMDSSGLGLIMGRLSVMRELCGEMTVWNPSRETRSILTLAGMERLVRIEYPQGSAPTEAMTPPPVAEAVSRRGRRPVGQSAAEGANPLRRQKKKAVVSAAGRKEKEA